jgi:GT2 family glycosyltransferase
LNSDVFPNAPGDFDDLAARLEADPGLGAVGPLLLFEDGAIQHQGMEFERLAAFCDMHFPFHPGKGLLPTADTGLRVAPAITGACMILRRAELETLGGLDPAFLVGDFEDSDLCLRLAASGKRVAVDHGVRMHHLERQSQAGSEQRWRMNLTLYNAWTHEQRWGTTLSASTPA